MSQLADALANLEEDEVARLVSEQIDAGVNATSVVEECRRGMDIVGERYKSGDYFLSELIVSGEIFKEAMKVIEPRLEGGSEGDKCIIFVDGDFTMSGGSISADGQGYAGGASPSSTSVQCGGGGYYYGGNQRSK